MTHCKAAKAVDEKCVYIMLAFRKYGGSKRLNVTNRLYVYARTPDPTFSLSP